MEPDYNIDENLVDNVANKMQQASDEYRDQIIAEELAATELKAAVGYDKNGRPDAINYSLLVAPLIRIVQDQNEKITYLQKKVKKLKMSQWLKF